jgi:CRISPR-associated endonuclease Cas1 subtype II
VSELVPYYGCHDTSLRVRSQMGWSRENKALIWTEIVREKILKQAEFLSELNKSECGMLKNYASQLTFGDETNREGHSAKVYFNALFNKDFSRSDDCVINAALNYGYSVILSMFNREIVANGYITQIGLFHNNMFNQFNLASDLMEPFRVLVDRVVYNMHPELFDTEQKHTLVNIINKEVRIDGKSCFLSAAVRIYCRSVFNAVEDGDVSLLRFYTN